MEFTFDMKMRMAGKVAELLEEGGLAAPAARYAAVVITEECMWKLKRFGIKVSGEEDSNLFDQ